MFIKLAAVVDREISGAGILPERGVHQVQRRPQEGQDGVQVADGQQAGTHDNKLFFRVTHSQGLFSFSS
jgi:hypothetical protein